MKSLDPITDVRSAKEFMRSRCVIVEFFMPDRLNVIVRTHIPGGSFSLHPDDTSQEGLANNELCLRLQGYRGDYNRSLDLFEVVRLTPTHSEFMRTAVISNFFQEGAMVNCANFEFYAGSFVGYMQKLINTPNKEREKDYLVSVSDKIVDGIKKRRDLEKQSRDLLYAREKFLDRLHTKIDPSYEPCPF